MSQHNSLAATIKAIREQIESRTLRCGQLGSAALTTAIQTMQQERTGQPRRLRARWNVSPLWEAKILLGVLRQQGLAGKGLVQAFEKWAPRIVGSLRSDINRLYSEQTGREMSDYILVQQADKAVRYNQLPPEAEVFRQALLNWGGPRSVESKCRINVRGSLPDGDAESSTLGKSHRTAGTGRTEVSEERGRMPTIHVERRGSVASVADTPPRKNARDDVSERKLLDVRGSKALLTTRELAILTGFKPKTIRRWVSRRLLNYIRVGNRFRFRAAAVELFLAQREVRK